MNQIWWSSIFDAAELFAYFLKKVRVKEIFTLYPFVLTQRNQKSRKNDPIFPQANPRPAFFQTFAL